MNAANGNTAQVLEAIRTADPDLVLLEEVTPTWAAELTVLDNVYTYRKELGRILAREHPVRADLVVPVLDSGNTAALGYAEESGIPYEQAMIRNHYVRRTFIEPDQKIRDFGVKIKLNPSSSAIAGKRIVLVDDSIVRGTTAKKIIKMLKIEVMGSNIG